MIVGSGNVTKLLRKVNYKVDNMGKIIYWQDPSEECWNSMQKYCLLLLSRDYSVIWATMIGNAYFKIIMHIYNLNVFLYFNTG